MSAQTGFPPAVVELIWRRDRGSCARCGRGLSRFRRGVDWAVHHRRPRGIGGVGAKSPWVNAAANGACLCTECHEWVEKHRDDARAAGWLVSRITVQKPSEIAITHALLGVVYLDDEGGATRA